MKRIYLLKELDCANCAAKMEKKIAAMDGVVSVSIQFMTTRMVLELDDRVGEAIIPDIEAAIHKIEPEVRLVRIG